VAAFPMKVEVERAFSGTGVLCTKLRNRPQQKTLGMPPPCALCPQKSTW